MTMTKEELAEILRLHKLWVLGDSAGNRADLRSADLRYADLRYADLRYADLQSADLRYADLRYADLRCADLQSADLRCADLQSADLRCAKNIADMWLDTGEKFSEYLSTVVPALLTAGGKTIKQIVGAGAWTCHSWENCPMAEAFSVKSEDDCPLLLRPRVRQFVQLFDAGLIPCPEDVAAASS